VLGVRRWCADDVGPGSDPIAIRAALLYLVPLLALLLGALCALWFAGTGAAQRDTYAAVGAAIGLVLAFVVLRRVARRSC
jgi:positive regulator of sigma E activity